ncbi:ATP-binding protein [Actinoplanes sp. HUAS TT8]|uniref:ATP-binding protein n=1 Tax=Actinoplanes sp. HUAS TT8 TaxID=3447453 RepID=UPI003F51BAA7
MTGLPDSSRSVQPEAVDFQALFESAPDLYLVLDPDLRIVAATDAYLQATLTRREQVLGRGIFEVFPDNPDDPRATGTANLRASLHRVLDLRTPDTMAVQKYDVERPAEAGGGFEERYWSPRNNPVLDATGDVIYILHQAKDVTEFVALQQHGSNTRRETDELRERTQHMQAEILRRSQELHEANQALRAADDAKNGFLSRVSHELRTPLNAILGFSELLSFSEIDDEHRTWAGLIYNAGRHLLALLDDVLDITRIEGGHLALTIEPVRVGALLTEVLDLVRPIADAAAVQLTPLPEIPPESCVAADRQRLRQVLMNLLSNAIKFNRPSGTVTVTVRSRPAHRLRIEVADTGRGIAAESLGALFTPFERLDAAKAGFEGTGLGLSLSRHLVTSMHGQIDVTSTQGKGSTFWVDLPTATPPDDNRGAGDGPGPLAPARHERPVRVLYVEDVAENVRLVTDVLAHRPAVTLTSATHAALGFDLACQERPDLILLDLHLPDMPGEELLALLKSEPATGGIPVVVLSADATEHSRARLRDAGATAYLTKPIAVRDLLATVDSILPATAPARDV